MTPTSNAALLRRANAAGYSRLIDWLDSLPEARAAMIEKLNDMSPIELANAFCTACDQATKSLSTLSEVIDYGPTVRQNGQKAFQALNRQYQQVMLLARNCIGNK